MSIFVVCLRNNKKNGPKSMSYWSTSNWTSNSHGKFRLHSSVHFFANCSQSPKNIKHSFLECCPKFWSRLSFISLSSRNYHLRFHIQFIFFPKIATWLFRLHFRVLEALADIFFFESCQLFWLSGLWIQLWISSKWDLFEYSNSFRHQRNTKISSYLVYVQSC